MKQISPKRLRRKNNILKKKIEGMSGTIESINPLPPEIENKFLENVIAFEEQYQKNPKQLTVFKMIGKPTGFKPVVEIPDNRMEQEWNELYHYLVEHGIDLQVCSPNIGPRELYRFATEELFKKKVGGFTIPGMMNCFIYDEFYPDHVYDNQVNATSCIENFFKLNEYYKYHFAKQFDLNDHRKISFEELTQLVKNYWKNNGRPKFFEVKVSESIVQKNYGKVSGTYKTTPGKIISNAKAFNWIVEFGFNKKDKYWLINKITIEGIEL